MTFGDAIEALKSGHEVTRMSWDRGPELWLSLRQAVFPMTSPFIVVMTANEPGLRQTSDLAPFVEETATWPDVMPWIPTHGDMLAGDWMIKAE